jgi:hypothetical protein
MKESQAVRGRSHFDRAHEYRLIMSQSRNAEELRGRLETFVRSNF